MRNKHEIVPTTSDHIEELADNMRQADIDEVWAYGHMKPLEALWSSVKHSPNPRTAIGDGAVFGIFGVAERSWVDNVGFPWLLTAPEIETHFRVFLRGSLRVVSRWKEDYTYLTNFVDVRNTYAINWLKWLKFELGDPQPFGPDRMPFQQFRMVT